MKTKLVKKIQYLYYKWYKYCEIAGLLWIDPAEITRLRKIKSSFSEKRINYLLEKINIDYDFKTLTKKEKWVIIFSLYNNENFFLEIDWEIKAVSPKISYFNKTKFYIW